jgi:Holliday junction resolvasome RuvABC endonuclease subunit
VSKRRKPGEVRAERFAGAVADQLQAFVAKGLVCQAELDKLTSGLTATDQGDGTIHVSSQDAACTRYLGIDPGLANLGIFVLGLTPTSARCLYRETLHTAPAERRQKADQLPARLRVIARRLHELVIFWRPVAVGYERLDGVTAGKEMAGKGNNDRAPLLMICGQLLQVCWLMDVPCFAIPTSTARVVVLGKGKTRGATKQQVRDRVRSMTGAPKLSLDQGDAGAFAFAAYARLAQEQRRR